MIETGNSNFNFSNFVHSVNNYWTLKMDWETPKAVKAFSRTSHPDFNSDLTRKQIETELEVLKLKEQVEKLGGAVQKDSKSPKWSEISLLEEENEDLRNCLEDAESKLVELQKEMHHLKVSYETDSLAKKAKIKDFNEMIESLKADKSKMQSNYDKCAKTLSGLKSYLKDVPSIDEFNEVKATLTTQEARCRNLLADLDTKNLYLEQFENKLKESNSHVAQIQSEKQEALLRLDVAEDKLKSHMKRLETSKRINPEERVESLEIENTRLKKYIQCLKSRNKKEQDQKEAQYKQSQNKIGTLSDELTAVNEQSIKYRENIDLLRNSLQNIETKYTSASKRIKILENELSNSHSSSDRAEEMNDTVQKLVKEFGVCLNEMNSLSILSKQVVSGEDPNLSLLLGVERLSATFLPLSEVKDSEDKLYTLKSQLVELKKIKKEISEMRQILADKYAENLGNNMTSCITQ
uniref:Uncharacterized protein n=1 Tax=Lepeophtheirus salmonis TaxID=72036 RepID=A0A0K2TQS9_LEPSM